MGKWTVGEPIGVGGWSTVYAARPSGRAGGPDLPAEVALKIMPTAGLAPRQARRIVESAHREVELGRRTGHPRLIGLIESFVLGAPDRPALDGAIVLVMERAAGSLRELLDAGVPEADRGRLIEGICAGLAHLHRAGWVHADLKPENVLLGRDGSVKLSDFGLAAELTGTHGYAPPLGTLDYLPPERWKAPLGAQGVQVRPSADIWALGVVIHEVFASGTSPFAGATPLARGAAVQEYGEGRAPLRMDHAVPPFWRQLAADCLAPTHEARAGHTADSLLGRIAAARRTPRRRRIRPRGRARAALLAVALCATAGAALSGGTPRDDPARPTGDLTVFNADRTCRSRPAREPQCSLGLAIDPMAPYTPANVVPIRVWHGDPLTAECRLPHGLPIVDEDGHRSTQWFRVHLPTGSTPPTAWLPAVRTRTHPSLPDCPHPSP
ncbi:serine/threonine-protein kinase [Actinocorallia herbida]|uniref:serine/threonine-protein kinase n=1 Tax=Actinocorallia herbida TaxID=58109 RepID=UPI001B885E1D|nr:serine/threonine-protein kinase [Actinocorallia herbida]